MILGNYSDLLVSVGYHYKIPIYSEILSYVDLTIISLYSETKGYMFLYWCIKLHETVFEDLNEIYLSTNDLLTNIYVT